MPSEWPTYFGGESIDLSSIEFTPQLLKAIPRHLARRFRALPISQNTNGALSIAVVDARDIDVVDSLQHLLKREIQFRVAEENQLSAFIERLYPSGAGDET